MKWAGDRWQPKPHSRAFNNVVLGRGFWCCRHPEAARPLGLEGVFLMLRWVWRCCHYPHVPLQAGGAAQPIWPHGCGCTGHIWLGRCGGLSRGSLAVLHLHLPLFPTLPAGGRRLLRLLVGCCGVGRRGDKGVLSHPAVGLGWLLSPRGSRRPPGQSEPGQTWRAAFMLAVLSCEGGRTIWSPLCQPNKPRNAGQALQILLTAAVRRAEPATRT